jgi:hypothetical protein
VKERIARGREKQKKVKRKKAIRKTRYSFMFSVCPINVFCVGYFDFSSILLPHKGVNFYIGNKQLTF